VFDAIVLTGGAASRLGGADKPALEVGGTTLLERVLAAVADAGRIVVVGPARPLSSSRPVPDIARRATAVATMDATIENTIERARAMSHLHFSQV